MKDSRIYTGDSVIVNERNGVIHNLGTLNWKIYGCISNNYITDEVIITEEQMEHIRERHPEAYTDVIYYIREILNDPDYILRDKHPNTGLIIKKIQNDEELFYNIYKIVKRLFEVVNFVATTHSMG